MEALTPVLREADPFMPTFRPYGTSTAQILSVRFTSIRDVAFAQIAVMSGRCPVVKGLFEAGVNVSGAVMSSAC